jgi:hypothetical protein
MRIGGFLFACSLILATGTAVAMQSQHGLPDIGKQYAERLNCHGAYDVLIEDVKAGRTASIADLAWGKSYEDIGKQPEGACPDAPPALLKRASNRTVVTSDGLGMLAKYHKHKDASAYFEAAFTVLTGKTKIVGPEVGWELLKVAVDLGDPSAQFFLGSLHVGGTFGKPSDYASAFPLIQQAAAGGNVDAQFMLANMYKEGLGTRKDSKLAFEWYTKAAEHGHVYAAYLAAYQINDGDGIKADHAVAYRLARNLADQDQVVGAVIAASALLQMKDAKDREDEVLYWLDVAIRDGDAAIRKQVGEMRPKVVAAFKRANAPPEYHPRVWKACPMKTVCYVDRFSGARQSCTTNKDYWNDCDG